MDTQILELLQIINNKVDTLGNENRTLNNKIDNVIDRINDLEKDINNQTSINSSSNEYLTVKEIMEIYKISKEKIYKDIKSNEFNQKYSQKKNGSKILIKKRDWELWFNSYVIPDMLEDYREKVKTGEIIEEDFSEEEKNIVEKIIEKNPNKTSEEKTSLIEKIKKGEDLNIDF